MATIHHDQAADLSLIQAKKIAVIGYGSQGHAHALNLRDSGCDVRVGLHPDSASRKKAEGEGLRAAATPTAEKEPDIIMVRAPDEKGAEIWDADLVSGLTKGKYLAFGHGF